ncbi:GNAT family N-acetyltransferase [Chloroflexota bacterium]
MSHSHYAIRNYQSADFDKFVLLNIEAEKLEPTGYYISPQIITEHLGQLNYSPEKDLFVVEIAGNLVGYMDVRPELGIGRVILTCWVHPEHRKKGLASKLLNYAARRAKELGAKVAHVNIAENNIVAKNMLARLGFECIRHFLELRLDMANARWQDIDQTALGCRYLKRSEEDKLTQIQNLSFAGTWGYNPNTVEEITYRINLSNCSPDDVVLVCDRDKVIGYCWTTVNYVRGTEISGRKGRIFMLGVDPNYRGRGVGKRVLLAGLAYLKSRGIDVVGLTVDSENEAACALYQAIGFEIRTRNLWYEKVLD